MHLELFNLHKKEKQLLSEKLFSKKNKEYGGSDKDAYIFAVPFISVFYGYDFSQNELEKIITDCSADGGIDGFIFGKKYIDIFDFKCNKGISDKEIDKLTISLEKYLNRKDIDFTGDEAIKSNMKKLLSDKKRKLRLIIAREKHSYSKEDLFLGRKGSLKIKNLIMRLEKIGIEVLFEDIESIFIKKLNLETVTGIVTLGIEKDLFAKNQQGSKEIIAKISIKTIFDEFIEKYGTKIISSNIRGHLNKKKFSDSITETLKADPDNFWIFHNGITITCSKIEPCQPNSGTVTIHNPQIVNGAQTVFGLYGAYKDGFLNIEKIKKGALICKIIEAKDDFTRKICETSNTQNAVKMEDLRSNDDIAVFLEEYIKIISKGKNTYKRKKGNSSKNGIPAAKLFQWVYSAFLEKPAAAKNEKQFLFDIVTNKGRYLLIEKSIQSNLKQLWVLCEIAFFIEDIIKNEKDKNKRSMLKHMDFHILAGLFYLKSKKMSDFNNIFNILNVYYNKEIKLNPSLNANKVFTKNNNTWLELKKKI